MQAGRCLHLLPQDRDRLMDLSPFSLSLRPILFPMRMMAIWLCCMVWGLQVPAQVFLITDFGASPARADNAPAIQAAIDAAAVTGGIVQVPAGHFQAGSIYLRSHLQLQLGPGAILQANPAAIQAAGERVFILADSLTDLTITGPGTILGTGQDTLAVSRFHPFPPPAFRYDLMHVTHSQRIRISQVTFRDAEMFTLGLFYCEDVLLDGLIIRNNYYRPNTDAIDPGHCKNVHITNCHITAGDDGICFKNACENVVISNCTIETPSTGIKFGTSTAGVFRNIHVTNCVIYNAMTGIGMYMKDGGLIEQCHFSHLTIHNIEDTLAVNPGIVHQQVPIFIDIDLRDSSAQAGRIRDITFSDISIHSAHPVLIQGMAVQPIENLTLRHIDYRVRHAIDLSRRRKPKGFADSKFYYHGDHRLTAYAQQPAWVTLAHVNGLVVDQVRVQCAPEVYTQGPRHALGIYASQGVEMQGVRLRGVPHLTLPVVQWHDVQDGRWAESPPTSAGPYLGLSGAATHALDLPPVLRPGTLVRSPEVPDPAE